MKDILGRYESLREAIDNELYDKAGTEMVQLNTLLRQLFATPPNLSASEHRQLAEISEFLSSACVKMSVSREEIANELASFSKAKQMKKAYGKL